MTNIEYAILYEGLCIVDTTMDKANAEGKLARLRARLPENDQGCLCVAPIAWRRATRKETASLEEFQHGLA